MPFDFFKYDYISINNFDGALHYPFVFDFKGINALLGAHTVDVLLSGVSPLTLLNAVSLNYIKAFGKCEQDLTPTPESPVDIVANNGAIKVKDDELPVGYKRLLDIYFDGNSYFETGEKLYGNDVVTMTLQANSSAGQNVFGAYSGTGGSAINLSLYVYATTSSQSYFRSNKTLLRPVLGTGKRTISFGNGSTSGFYKDVTYDVEEFETTDTAQIGALPNSSSPKFAGYFYGNITIGNRLKYIPCERVSDSAIGYYETVNGEFLENQGTGTLTTSGYDTSHLTEIYYDGTVETVSVDTTGSSATCQPLLSVGNYKDVQNITNGAITRNVGVVVLDGTEEGWVGGSSQKFISLPKTYINPATVTTTAPVLCTHLLNSSSYTSEEGTIFLGVSNLNINYNNVSGGQSSQAMAGFKAWLASQYAAGTPVIVVYPLATPTTEAVTGQTLTITQGTNIVTAEGSVDDLELEISYKAYAEVTVEEIEAVNTDENVEVTIS